MSVYLYRAISLEESRDEYTDELIYGVGSAIGRQSGYLSRSSAVDAGRASGARFEVRRSEPVVFLTEAETLSKQIRELTAELEKLRASEAVSA